MNRVAKADPEVAVDIAADLVEAVVTVEDKEAAEVDTAAEEAVAVEVEVTAEAVVETAEDMAAAPADLEVVVDITKTGTGIENHVTKFFNYRNEIKSAKCTFF